MSILRFKHFIRRPFLRRIGRPLLNSFFARFESDLKGAGLVLPQPDVADETFYDSLAQLVASPDILPEELSEALFAIDGMASPEGQEQIEAALDRAGPGAVFDSNATRQELALRVWLADPALLARLHNRQRMRRLTAFACFGPELPVEPGTAFRPPDTASLRELAEALDPWFALHQRGHNTTRVEAYPIVDDCWFLVRHGDTFSRTPKVEAQRTEIIHFRPERDDVVVYSPGHDELRINARTRGERELYVKAFGRWLHGTADWFSRRRTYTLEPLRAEGADALNPAGLEGLSKITLRKLELTSDGAPHEVITREAEDLFGLFTATAELMPAGWRLTRAAFELHFTDQGRPRPVQIRPPNLLKLGRHCDLRLVDQWLREKGFRMSDSPVEVAEDPQSLSDHTS